VLGVGGHGWGKVDDGDSISRVSARVRARRDLFDTADCYGLGKSERFLRKALGGTSRGFSWRQGRRPLGRFGRVWNDSSPAYLRAALEASLRRLGLERIPLYYIHKPTARSRSGDRGGAFAVPGGGADRENRGGNFTAAQAKRRRPPRPCGR
jgi:aryl-alcohol dehydrogenase-like predicted oxidoreductase